MAMAPSLTRRHITCYARRMMTTKQQSESLDQTTRIDPKPLCACRCGSLTNSPRATYSPGHDARHVSRVLRDLQARCDDIWDDWTHGQPVTAELYNLWVVDLAYDHFSARDALRAKFHRAADRAWSRRVAAQNKANQAAAETSA